ncbi:MAG: TetR/AcrR family transcriptional regulator [Acidimicrobiales bacterium]
MTSLLLERASGDAGAVPDEAGVAKGVMHRHFADFDTFLAELILDRAAQLDATANAVAGTGTVVDNLTDVLTAAFMPLAVAMVSLVITRDGLRDRLRGAGAARFPLLAEVSTRVTAYLTEEQALGRVAATADIPTLSHMLIGSVHLLFTNRESGPPDAEALHKVVAGVMQGAVSTKGSARRSWPSSRPSQRS